MRRKVELATREFAAVAVNGGFQLRHELHELGRLPDLIEQRIAFEQRIPAESGRDGFADRNATSRSRTRVEPIC